jgi:predicted NBD/HSP70 family sugar kinase
VAGRERRRQDRAGEDEIAKRPRVGVDAGGTKLLLVAQWPDRRLVHRLPTGIDFSAPQLENAVRAFIGTLDATPALVGVAVPGLVGPDGRVVACDTLPGLVGWSVESLAAGFPVRAVNDAEAALREELHDLPAGATAGVVMVGTGIGAAFVAGGRLLRGASGWAGELGSIPMAGPQAVKILDELASGAALLKECGVPAESLQARAAAGDESILDSVRRAGHALGLGLAAVIDLLNPSVLALGGGVLDYPGYLEAAGEAARRHTLPDLWRACALRRVRAGELVAALGAIRDPGPIDADRLGGGGE